MRKLFFILLIAQVSSAQVYNSPCPYDNSVRDTLDFTAAGVGASHSSIVWTGDYIWAIGMKASMTYGITTCIDPFNVRDNDSHISIYTHGGGQALAFNDDDCTNHQYHSTVVFTPPADGDYDILFDEHTGVYCSHVHDPFDYFDYYIEVLNFTEIIEQPKKDQSIKQVVDILGRPTTITKNRMQFYIYESGIVDKRVIVD